MTGRRAVVGSVMVAFAFGVMMADAIRAQQPAPAAPPAAGGRGSFGAPAGPCGPQGQLGADVSKNVDSKARCFEVRRGPR